MFILCKHKPISGKLRETELFAEVFFRAGSQAAAGGTLGLGVEVEVIMVVSAAALACSSVALLRTEEEALMSLLSL